MSRLVIQAKAWRLFWTQYRWPLMRTLFLSLRYELGRVPASTKLSANTAVRKVRCRGGNQKFRALRLDAGNFSWGSEVRGELTCARIYHRNRSDVA